MLNFRIHWIQEIFQGHEFLLKYLSMNCEVSHYIDSNGNFVQIKWLLLFTYFLSMKSMSFFRRNILLQIYYRCIKVHFQMRNIRFHFNAGQLIIKRFTDFLIFVPLYLFLSQIFYLLSTSKAAKCFILYSKLLFTQGRY